MCAGVKTRVFYVNRVRNNRCAFYFSFFSLGRRRARLGLCCSRVRVRVVRRTLIVGVGVGVLLVAAALGEAAVRLADQLKRALQTTTEADVVSRVRDHVACGNKQGGVAASRGKQKRKKG